MNDLVASLKLPYQTIERDFEGIDLARLEELFKTGDIKFFYSISRFSNPLGLSYSTSEKQKIVKLAECYDVYIIEDDYMGDFANLRICLSIITTLLVTLFTLNPFQ